MYLAAILSTIAAWFMGLFLDVNLQLEIHWDLQAFGFFFLF